MEFTIACFALWPWDRAVVVHTLIPWNKLGHMPDPECSWVGPDSVETILSWNGLREYGLRGMRLKGVRLAWYEACPQACPNGAPRGGRAFNCAKRDFALCQGDALVHSGAEISVNMPSALATHLRNCASNTLFDFRIRPIRDFAGHFGDTPKVTLPKSFLAPTETVMIGKEVPPSVVELRRYSQHHRN